MKKRIDIIIQKMIPFTYPTYTASKMKVALEEEGIEVSIFPLGEGMLQKYINYALEEPPLGLITFETTLFTKVNLPLLLHAPALCIPQNALTPIAHFLEEREKILALPDRKLASYAKGYFLPQPIEPLFTKSSSPRMIKIASFADLLDLTHLQSIWKKFFPPKVFEALQRWSQEFQKSKEIHPLQQMLSLPEEIISLCQGISGHDLFFATTQYLQASKIKPLVESFHSLPLHLFGTHIGKNLYRSLSNGESIHLHALPPYQQILNLLEEIEIVVIEPLDSLDGPPEYFFHALQKGALPLTPPSEYLIELFGQSAPLFYRNHEELLEKCHFYLENPRERCLLIEELRAIDMSPFFWKSAATTSFRALSDRAL